MTPFRKLYLTNNPDLNRVQDNVGDVLLSLSNDVLLTRTPITATITTSTLTISHNLGKVPNGWFIFDKNADANVWRTAWDKNTITLDSSATVTIKFYLF